VVTGFNFAKILTLENNPHSELPMLGMRVVS
jgi:hypothetical protein